MQSISLTVGLGEMGLLEAFGALAALLLGAEAEDGFWAGVTVGGVILLLSIAYLCCGGLLEWLSTRQRCP